MTYLPAAPLPGGIDHAAVEVRPLARDDPLDQRVVDDRSERSAPDLHHKEILGRELGIESELLVR